MRTHSIFFFCTVLLLISSNTYMMQSPDISLARTTIALPKNANEVALLENNPPQLIFFRKKGCNIIDVAAPHVQIKINKNPCSELIINPYDPTKIAMSCKVKNDYTTIIYDTQAKKTYPLAKPFSLSTVKIAFMQSDNTIMVTSLITSTTTLYNYITKTEQDYTLLNNVIALYKHIHPASIQHHPTKQEVAFLNFDDKVCIHDLVTKSCLRQITAPDPHFCNFSYSSCGKYLKLSTENSSPHSENLIHIQSGKQTQQDVSYADCIAWHPHDPYMVEATSQLDPASGAVRWWKLEYYNMKKNEKIANDYIHYNQFTNFEYLIFPANNDSILLIANSECLLFDTPFDTIKKRFYPRGTKDKLILLYFLLKNYQCNDALLLPDIVKIFIQKTMNIAKL